MMHYFVAQIKITDPSEYQKYLDSVDEVFSKYKGEYLAVDENPTILEGQWDYNKSIIIRFDSKKDFEDWYYSADYQNILKFRLKGSHCDSILVSGE